MKRQSNPKKKKKLKKKTADTSQLTKLKEPCGLDCVRKWFTLNKYTYTHTAGQGGAEIKGVLVKKLSNTLMLHSKQMVSIHSLSIETRRGGSHKVMNQETPDKD